MENKKSLDWSVLYTPNEMFCEKCGVAHKAYLDGICRATTFGLEEKYGHTEFEFVLNLDPRLVGYILNTLGLMVADGRKFQDKDVVPGLLSVDIHLHKIVEHGKEFLRAVVPDAKGLWPGDKGCEYPYSAQLISIDELEQDTSHYKN